MDPPATPEPPASGGEKVYPIAESAFKRIKEEAREKGRKEGMETFAKELGYASVEAMKKALGRRSTRPAATPARTEPRSSTPPPSTDGDGAGGDGGNMDVKEFQRSQRRLERRLELSDSKNTELHKKLRQESSSRRKLGRERNALEAEMLIREAAARVGVKDVDYAMRLLTRDLEGKTEEDLKTFDEGKFFEGLRKPHPYLFGETTQPATTGNNAGSAPTAPNPGAAAGAAASGGQVDARTMDRKDYLEHLKARGLQLSV